MVTVLALSMVLAAGEAEAATPDPAAFPVPAEKGMRLDAKATQFRVPFGMARVERFYRDQFRNRKGVTFVKTDEGERSSLTIRNERKGDDWAKAVVTTDGTRCTIAVTPITRFGPEDVRGKAPPVQFVFARSGHVQKQIESIDHAQR